MTTAATGKLPGVAGDATTDLQHEHELLTVAALRAATAIANRTAKVLECVAVADDEPQPGRLEALARSLREATAAAASVVQPQPQPPVAAETVAVLDGMTSALELIARRLGNLETWAAQAATAKAGQLPAFKAAA